MFGSRPRLKFFVGNLLLLLLFLFFGVPQALASSFGVSVQASCGVQVDFGTGSNHSYNSTTSGQIPGLGCGGSGFAADFYGPGEDAMTMASSVAGGSVGFGSVGVNLETKATSTPLIDGAIADASVNASWFDTLTITGPSQGAPVQFELTGGIAGSMSCGGETAGNVFYQVSWGQATTISFSDNNCSNPLAGKQNAIITVSVGQKLIIGGEILSSARAIAGNTIDGKEILTSENDVSAPDTFSLVIKSLTPGASYISAAGADYASATPEPSTWAMLIVSFAGLAFVSWRRGRRPGSSPYRRNSCSASTVQQGAR